MRRVVIVLLLVLAGSLPLHADGISQDRAHQLASDYFVRYFQIGCGGVGVPSLHGDHWEAPLHLGVAGTLSGYIQVDARTGAASYGRPSAQFPLASAASLEAWAADLKERARRARLKKKDPKDLTNRWSQPLAAVKSTFDFMKQFQMSITLAAASGGSAPSR